MNIEKLEIRGFGRFNNRTLNFTHGLNIVFGNNESGKSTVQSFIKGMLYGLKGGRAGRDGLPSPIKRHKPWCGNEYSGFIEYSLDKGEVYRVGRNFDTNTVKIFDSIFNDITGSFAASKERGALFAEKHLGINEQCFDKTAFIKQMETRIENDQSRELINRIMNAEQTGFEDVSLKKAQEALKEALKVYVGNEKTSIRPLDKAVASLNELKGTRDRLLEKKNSLLEVQKRLKTAVDEKNRFEEKKTFLTRLEEICEVRKQLDRINEKYSSLINALDNQKSLKVLIAEKTDAVSELELRLERVKQFRNINIGTGDKILELKKNIEGLKKELYKYDTGNVLKSINNSQRQEKLYNALTGVFTAAALIFTAFYFSGFSSALYAAVLSALALVSALIKRKAAAKALKASKNEKKTAIAQTSCISDQIRNMEKQIDDILKSAGAENIEDFFRLKGIYDVAIQKLESENNELERLENENRICLGDITSLLESITGILSSSGTFESEFFGAGIPANYDIAADAVKKEIFRLEGKLNVAVDNLYVYDGNKSYMLPEILSGNVEELGDFINSDYSKTCSEINNLLLSIKEFETLLKSSYNDEELQKVEEGIAGLEERKMELEDMDFSLKTAYDVLSESGMEMQRDFAPALNSKISIIISKITSNRYNDLRVDDHLSIKAIDPETQDVVPASVLSGGTVDQIYLALRLGMSDLMAQYGESLPVLMDEVLSQYDDVRTREAFGFFKDLSKDRQIILFTCKRREVDIAKEVCGDSFNLIEL